LALSKTQEALLTKLKELGTSELAVTLDNEVCSYLLAIIVSDLGLFDKFPEIDRKIAAFFGTDALSSLRIARLDFNALYERLLGLVKEADAYFYCLGTLHKARLKYERILQAQPIPTVDQVGPRALLQFGALRPAALAAFLFWRKWIFDIDNRAGQETGYLFEPIIASAIGGVPAPARKSPVKRKGGTSGRQVDCLRASDKRAYEIKLRVTIAASGQGRWGEELQFPEDARTSGYTPVLIVLDPTSNDKLTELENAFKAQKGEVYIGPAAWKHLAEKAGATMATFLERYVHSPLQSLLDKAPEKLPDLLLHVTDGYIEITIGDSEKLAIKRSPKSELASGEDEVPNDIDNHTPTL
jgi:hypothetical protein